LLHNLLQVPNFNVGLPV